MPAPRAPVYRDYPQANTPEFQRLQGAQPRAHKKPRKHLAISRRWPESHPLVIARYAPTQARSQSFAEWTSLIAWTLGQRTDGNPTAAPLVGEVLCSCETRTLLGSNILIAQRRAKNHRPPHKVKRDQSSIVSFCKLLRKFFWFKRLSPTLLP